MTSLRTPRPRSVVAPRRRGSTTLASLLALAGIVSTAVGCSEKPPIGTEGRLGVADGVVITSAGGRSQPADRTRTLRSGDLISVGQVAARIDLPGGASLDLAPRTTLLVDRGPDLRSGDVLVVAPSGTQRLRIGESVLEARTGAARARVDFGLLAVTYTGSSTLLSGGRDLVLPALRSASIPAVGLVPADASPLPLAVGDPWDRRFLADVLDQREPLEARASGFRGQRIGDGRSVGLYRRLFPGLEQEAAFQQGAVDRTTDAGQALLASAIALLGRRGSFSERFSGALAFHAQGAPWSLVAEDQGVPSLAALVTAIDEAINREAGRLELVAPPLAPTPPPTATPTTRGPAGPTRRPSPSTTTTTTRPAPRTTTPSPPQATPPPAPPEEPTPASPVDPLLDSAVELIDELLGGS